MMPTLDGFGLLAAIRGDERIRSVPVILLSARAGEEARIEGLHAGADEYLVKPFSARELLACVASQIELSRMRHESEQQLREADRRKDEFWPCSRTSFASLAPIRAGLELIRLAGDDAQSVRRVRSMMEQQVTQMVRLIDDLLDVARIASGKIVLQRTPTSLAELVQSAIDAQRAAIDAAQVELTVDLARLPCVVDVGSDPPHPVLSILLHNASKFTPPGGRVRISSEIRAVDGTSDSQVVIAVSDTGIGISGEMLPHVFFILYPGRGADGTFSWRTRDRFGPGSTLVELHGGDITAHSDGRGSGGTFAVRLSLYPVPYKRFGVFPCRAGSDSDQRRHRR